jgi:hypothetical protein
LAEKLLGSVGGDAECSQWVRDAKSQQTTPATRRGALVLASDQQPLQPSITANFQISPRSAALVATFADFVTFVEALRKQNIVGPNLGPNDFPLDVLRIELKGDPTTLGGLVTQRAAGALSAMLPPKILGKGGTMPKDIEPFLGVPNVAYFTAETPAMPPNTSMPMLPFLVTPKSLDDLLWFPDPAAKA